MFGDQKQQHHLQLLLQSLVKELLRPVDAALDTLEGVFLVVAGWTVFIQYHLNKGWMAVLLGIATVSFNPGTASIPDYMQARPACLANASSMHDVRDCWTAVHLIEFDRGICKEEALAWAHCRLNDPIGCANTFPFKTSRKMRSSLFALSEERLNASLARHHDEWSHLSKQDARMFVVVNWIRMSLTLLSWFNSIQIVSILIILMIMIHIILIMPAEGKKIVQEMAEELEQGWHVACFKFRTMAAFSHDVYKRILGKIH